MRIPRAVNRNPYPVPDVSSEGFWYGNGPALGRNVTMNDRNWSSRLSACDRLFAHHTLNSVRRHQNFVRDMVPNDGLDFALASIYIHSEDFMVPKCYVPMQPETMNYKTWRVLRNELNPQRVSTAQTKGIYRNSVNTNNYSNSATVQYDRSVPKFRRTSQSSEFSRKSANNRGTKNKRIIASRGYSGASANNRGSIVESSSPQREYGGASPRNSKTNTSRVPKGITAQRGKTPAKHHQDKVSSSSRGYAKKTAEKSKTTSRTGGYGDHHRSSSSATRSKQNSKTFRSRDTIDDDVLDKEARRQTYAAQMRPIERVHPSSLKLIVDGPHSDLTNPGYSRKIDGTFYGI